jgi:hypothetical protein
LREKKSNYNSTCSPQVRLEATKAGQRAAGSRGHRFVHEVGELDGLLFFGIFILFFEFLFFFWIFIYF